jgi:hypothetical protein
MTIITAVLMATVPTTIVLAIVIDVLAVVAWIKRPTRDVRRRPSRP